MGRVARSGGGGGGDERAKTIGKPRTKRRKRRDLEELRRNVLGAKRNLHVRAPQNKKRTTALGKVVNHFADARQANEDTNHSSVDKRGGKKKSRTICNRLLPEQIFGIYQNGAKGQEVRRANQDFSKIKAARLEGDVLKLLNGDETNPKFPRNGDEKRSDESDSADICALGKTKGVNGVNGEKKRMNLIAKNTLTDARNNQLQFFQRTENNHKRRLFEPIEDDSTDSCRLKNAAVPMDLSSNETRFPPQGIARNVSLSKDCFRNKEHVESTEMETRRKSTKKSMPFDGNTIDANFWGWSPATYYETLCAKISAENFENNRAEEPRSRDPVVKIRRALRDFYRNTSRFRSSSRKAIIIRENKNRENQTQSKVNFPLEDASLSSTTEIQACTADSELDQESSDSEASKIGSWRPKHFSGIYGQKDRSASTDTNETILKSENRNKEDNLKQKKRNLRHEDRNNGVEKTIHEVSAFLERLREENPSNEKGHIFEAEVAAARFSRQNENMISDMSLRNFSQRNTKHVPTILRRSNGRYNFAEGVNEKPSSHFPVNGTKRTTRTICAMPWRSSREHENFDKIPTPSIVACRATAKKPKSNVRKSKLNVTDYETKCTLDARSSSSERQEEVEELMEKRDEIVANGRELSTSGFFVNPMSVNNRDWYNSDFAEPTLENCAEEARKNRRLDLCKKHDFYESNRRTNETSFSEFNDYEFPGPSRRENPNYSSFEHVRSEVFDKLGDRDRRSFANKMVDVPPRFSREASREVLSEREKCEYSSRDALSKREKREASREAQRERENREAAKETRLSDVGPSAARRSEVIQLPPAGYVDRAPADDTRNRSFQPLSSYDALSLDRPPVNEASGCAERSRGGAALRQRVRKPVMLFRPIQETRQRQETRDSRYRPSETAEATINDAVTNFRVLTFDENDGDRSSPQHRCSQTYRVHRQPQQRQQQQLQSQSHFNDDNPTKYRAVEAPDGSNPCRLPVYVNSDGNRVDYEAIARVNCQAKPKNVSNGIGRPEALKMFCDAPHGEMTSQYFGSRGGSDQQRQQQQLQSQNRFNEDKPAKYIAVSAPDGENPYRLPVYVNSDSNRVAYEATARYNCHVKPKNVSNAIARPETSKIVFCDVPHGEITSQYFGSRGGSDSRIQNAGNSQHYEKERQLREPWSAQANQVTVVLPYGAPFYPQTSTTSLAVTAAGSSSVADVPVVYSMAPCETAVPAEGVNNISLEMRYQLQPSMFSQPRYDVENHTKRIQLPDGRIGIIVTDNRAMDNPVRLSSGCGPTLTVNGIDVGNLNERNRPGLTKERIYY